MVWQTQTELSESNPFSPRSRLGRVERTGRCGKLCCPKVSPASPRLQLMKPHLPESASSNTGFHHLLVFHVNPKRDRSVPAPPPRFRRSQKPSAGAQVVRLVLESKLGRFPRRLIRATGPAGTPPGTERGCVDGNLTPTTGRPCQSGVCVCPSPPHAGRGLELPRGTLRAPTDSPTPAVGGSRRRRPLAARHPPPPPR